jgi:hypothetical protein
MPQSHILGIYYLNLPTIIPRSLDLVNLLHYSSIQSTMASPYQYVRLYPSSKESR